MKLNEDFSYHVNKFLCDDHKFDHLTTQQPNPTPQSESTIALMEEMENIDPKKNDDWDFVDGDMFAYILH